MSTLIQVAAKPLSVSGVSISADDVCRIIEGIANAPLKFAASDLIRFAPGDYQFAQEVLNRLFQRWRKLGLVAFKQGRWTLATGAWDQFQAAVRHARMTQPREGSRDG